MSFFSQLVRQGLGLVRQAAGETITYRTTSGFVVITNVTPLRGVEREQAGERRILEADEMDWGLAAADLVIGDTLVQPDQGHTITRILNGQSLTYTVTASNGDKPWTWSDPGGQTQYRVHTKLTGKS
jgi:hypothetical protein